MSSRVEWVGRYRKTSNTFAVFIPYELRQQLQAQHGWKPGDYLVMVANDGLLMIRRVEKAMLLDRSANGAARQPKI
jgi:antitoxin component of MazEF toxin-antitoxin module